MSKFSNRLRKPSKKLKVYEDNKKDSTICRVLPYSIAKNPTWIDKCIIPLNRSILDTYYYNNNLLPGMFKHNTFKLEQL